jgi:hypothetical protein
MWLPQLADSISGDDVTTRAMLQLPINWLGWEPIIGLILLFAATVAMILWQSVSAKLGSCVLLVASFATFWIAQVSIIPRVEELTQTGIIEFYKQTSSRYEKVYFEPIVHHSYAHLFYGNRPINQDMRANDEHWLLTGNVDAPVFFVIRKNRFEEILGYHPQLIIIDEWGPYYFLTRKDEGYRFRGSR